MKINPSRTAILVSVVTFGLLMSSNAWPLTMHEAVERSLQGNHSVRLYKDLQEAQRSRVGVERSAFLPSLDLSYAYTDRNQMTVFQPKESSVLTASASYNLFSGFADRASFKEAASRLKAAEYEAKGVEADIVLSTRQAFINALRAKQDVNVAREAVELLEKQSHDAGLFYREGIIAKNEVLRVEVELASARQDLLKAESGYIVARRTLQRVMGAALGDDEALEEPEIRTDYALPTEEALSVAMFDGRSELRYLRAVKEAAGYAVEAEKGGFWPSVDLSFSHLQYGDSINPDGSLENYGRQDMAVLQARWNLFNGFGTKNAVSAAESEHKAAGETLMDLEAELALQLRTAMEDYRVAYGSRELAQTALEQAQENYRITENQFRQRVATTTDLLDARVFLTRARTNLNDSVYNQYIAFAALERIIETDLPVE